MPISRIYAENVDAVACNVCGEIEDHTLILTDHEGTEWWCPECYFLAYPWEDMLNICRDQGTWDKAIKEQVDRICGR